MGQVLMRAGGGRVTVEGLAAEKLLGGATVTVRQGSKTLEAVTGTALPHMEMIYYVRRTEGGTNYGGSGKIGEEPWYFSSSYAALDTMAFRVTLTATRSFTGNIGILANNLGESWAETFTIGGSAGITSAGLYQNKTINEGQTIVFTTKISIQNHGMTIVVAIG